MLGLTFNKPLSLSWDGCTKYEEELNELQEKYTLLQIHNNELKSSIEQKNSIASEGKLLRNIWFINILNRNIEFR